MRKLIPKTNSENKKLGSDEKGRVWFCTELGLKRVRISQKKQTTPWMEAGLTLINKNKIAFEILNPGILSQLPKDILLIYLYFRWPTPRPPSHAQLAGSCSLYYFGSGDDGCCRSREELMGWFWRWRRRDGTMGVIYLSHVSFSTITFLFLSLLYLHACGGAFLLMVLASKLYLLFQVLNTIQSEISSVVIWKMFSKK